MIVGIIPLIYLKVKEPDRKFPLKKLALSLFPMLALVAVSGLRGVLVADPAEAISNIGIPFMLFIFFAGMLAAAALVIPGVSGSFVLLMLGIYPLATYSVSRLSHWLADITNARLLLDICKVLAPLGIGVTIGGLSMVKLIERLLKNHYKSVYAIIFGLLIGSVYVLFNEQMVFNSYIEASGDINGNMMLSFFRGEIYISAPIIIIGIATFVLGCFISFIIGKKRL